MALVAVETCCEKQMGGIFHRILWFPQDFVVCGFRVFLVGSGRNQDFANKFIVGCIAADFFADPVPERLGSLRSEKLAIHL